ncbi:GNAT family protein [Bacillus sp. REN3]|uniref:GNAT family N-acetyltransferase n=1 Tax=Bacillus sp. REN3 TaxID=2802440 RepID=UPI001AEE5063|nr:GNAT family protein [Bacillus sp. REN3]
MEIREAKLEDAARALEIQKEVIAEEDYFIFVSEEFDKTVDDMKQWICNILKNERDTMLVAELDSMVVGWIVFSSQRRMRVRHTGNFGIMIQKDYRNQGIGKKLIQALLDWAKRNPLIEKVGLGVFSTNNRAIAVYSSLGFKEEGRKVKEFKFKDGTYSDDILMYKLVKDLS